MSHAHDVIDNQLYMSLQKSKWHTIMELMDFNQIKVIYCLSLGSKGGRYPIQTHRSLSKVRKLTMGSKFL